MAFTFQINEGIQFNHDEVLLKKAEENTPGILHETVTPKRVVELAENTKVLGGVGTKDAGIHPEMLAEKKCKRDDSIILDFGDHCVGKFSVHIDSVGCPMDAPLSLRLRFAEIPAELAAESRDYNGWLSKSWIQEEFIHIDELPAELELPRRYSFRYAEITVLDTSPKWQAVFSDAKVVTETSADMAAIHPETFEDEELQKIYDVSIKTLADCMQEVFEDGPKRDRRLWLGDLRLQALANYASFDSRELVKCCLYLFAGMTTTEGKIPANVFVRPKNVPDDTFLYDYSLFFISTLYDYLQVHPEKELLEDLYPICKKQMNISLESFNDEGKFLWDDSNPVFVDWSNEFNKETAGQAIVIYVLKQFIALANMAGDKDTAAYEGKLQLIESYAKEHLFDRQAGFFVSGDTKEINIASQVWMVLAGVLSQEDNHSLMERTAKKLFPVTGIATPYMYHHITEALFAAGCKEEAVKLMKTYWGGMIELGADTYWEAFDPNRPEYSPYDSTMVNSYCHAWGCTPVYLLKKYL